MENFNHSCNDVSGNSSVIGKSSRSSNSNNKNALQSTVVVNDSYTKNSSLHRRHKSKVEYFTSLKECEKLNREEKQQIQHKYEPKRRFVWWRRVLSNVLLRRNRERYYNNNNNNNRRRETNISDRSSSSSSSNESSSTEVDKNKEGKSELYGVESYNECHQINTDEIRAARLRERRQQMQKSAQTNATANYKQNKKEQFKSKYKTYKEIQKENEFDWKCCLWCAIGILLIGTVCMSLIFYALYVHDESFREWLYSFHVINEKLVHGKINGWSSLEHPELLPSLQIRLPRKMSAKELESKYNSVDFVYTYVNGSEQNHVYRKIIWDTCGEEMLQKEQELYWESIHANTDRNNENIVNESRSGNSDKTNKSHECVSKLFTLPTTREVLEYMSHQAENSVNSRDRDWDELKYSIRSVEQNIAWHRGRLMIVSPGHIPHWLHLARNFFGDNSLHTSTLTEYVEKHNWLTERTSIVNSYHHITFVHQDALLPHYMHVTFNSHVIEEHLWRLRNLSAMHIYFNDDYFINRPVSIVDFFNEYGGAVIRSESKKVKRAARARDKSISWIDSVKHIHLFATVELDVHAEDYLPPSLALKWSEAIMEELKKSKHNTLSKHEQQQEIWNSIRVPTTLLSNWIDVVLHDPPPPSLPWSITPSDLATLHKLHNSHSQLNKEQNEKEEFLELKEDENVMIDKRTDALVQSNSISDNDGESELEELLSESSSLRANNTIHDSEKEKKVNDALKATKTTRKITSISTSKLTAKEKETIILQVSQRDKRKEEKGRWQARWAQTHLPTHAPFVYCTNMFRYFATRYERELSHVDYYNRKRMANNYLMPMMYSAFALSRPWQASPSFLPYLMQHHKMINVESFAEFHNQEVKNNTTTTNSNVNKLSSQLELVINLDNDDGCAPVTQLVGNASDTLYTKLTNDRTLTAITANRLQRNNPLFFNINAGCNSSECATYMYLLLESKYASPIYLDYDDELVHEPNVSDMVMNDAFHSLMQLPLIVLTEFEENICPLIRSLQFALPAFTGDIYVFIIVEEQEEEDENRRHINTTDGINIKESDHDNNTMVNQKNDKSKSKLQQIRDAYHFTLRSTAPVLGCTFNDKVHIKEYYHKLNNNSASNNINNSSNKSSFSLRNDFQQIITEVLFTKHNNNSAFVECIDNMVKLPSFVNTEYANKTISAFLIDSRITLPAEMHISNEQTEHKNKLRRELSTLLRTVLAIPAELLSLKDFTVLTTTKLMEESAEYTAIDTKESNHTNINAINTTTTTQQTHTGAVKSLLVLRREYEADNMNTTIHWITGGTERDLLISYPLPYEKYENLNTPPLRMM